LPFKKLACLEDPRFVLLQSDATNAWCRAVFDDVVHTSLIIGFARFQSPAGSNTEPFFHPLQRRAQGTCVRKWPEIPATVLFLEASKLKPGDGIRKIYLHQQEAFIVAKTDIILRTKFFDQLALKEQCLRLVTNEMRLKIPNAIEQRACLKISGHSAGGHEILGEALA
jgi:hypothetical protein